MVRRVAPKDVRRTTMYLSNSAVQSIRRGERSAFVDGILADSADLAKMYKFQSEQKALAKRMADETKVQKAVGDARAAWGRLMALAENVDAIMAKRVRQGAGWVETKRRDFVLSLWRMWKSDPVLRTRFPSPADIERRVFAKHDQREMEADLARNETLRREVARLRAQIQGDVEDIFATITANVSASFGRIPEEEELCKWIDAAPRLRPLRMKLGPSLTTIELAHLVLEAMAAGPPDAAARALVAAGL